ncbi:hypothetical protein [Agromyces sp. LHK192]|uniref:hypothetical protein n=1 Tax=Agromyces sp. LHK192 TaxID=2498704 RepID=UPI000FD6D76A|nr:hypothetical protein [Agromyces sp. LHK192]
MSAQDAGVVVGGEPRASLLPAEIRAERASKKMRRGLVLGVIATVVVAVLAVGGVFALQFNAALQLALAQQGTTALLQQQAEYGEVRQLRGDVTRVQAAQQLAVETEIDWKAYLEQVQTTLPQGVVITQVDLDSATPLVPYAQSTAPLQGARVATIAFTATSPTLPEVPRWLDGLAALPGFVDALPGETVANENGTWEVDITMHVGEEVYTGRFAPEQSDEAASADPASTTKKDGE